MAIINRCARQQAVRRRRQVGRIRASWNWNEFCALLFFYDRARLSECEKNGRKIHFYCKHANMIGITNGVVRTSVLTRAGGGLGDSESENLLLLKFLCPGEVIVS